MAAIQRTKPLDAGPGMAKVAYRRDGLPGLVSQRMIL